MRQLGATGKQWLKSIHLMLSVIWLGGVVCMNLLRWLWDPAAVGGLYALDHTIKLIDQMIVYPAALSALVTGFLESWLTTWRFFRYRWVIVKWGVTLALILYGILFQGPWLNELETISQHEGLAALHNPLYLQDRLLDTASALVMISALTTLPFISVLKPWVKRDRQKHRQHRKGSASRPVSAVLFDAVESD